MALHFQIQVNGIPIGYVYVQRLNEVIEKGVPSRYKYEVKLEGSFIGQRDMVAGNIEHIYEDGVLALIHKVLLDVERKRMPKIEYETVWEERDRLREELRLAKVHNLQLREELESTYRILEEANAELQKLKDN